MSVDQPQKTVAESRESPRTLKIPEALPDQDLRRETEEEFDVDAEFDDDEIESELEDADDAVSSPDDVSVASQRKRLVTPPSEPSPASPTPRTPKRTLEELGDLSGGLDENGNVVREGTPPKRARLADTEPVPKQSATPSPMRLRKRSSEELEDGAPVVQSGKRVRA